MDDVDIAGRKNKNLVGKRFGRLEVVDIAAPNKHGKRTWLCKCDCGNNSIQTTGDLNFGRVVSCGCLKKEKVSNLKRSHGNAPASGPTSEYNIWNHIISRCTKPSYASYKNYGARGIDVCERWLKFENFLADMGKKPEGMSIDRIDNNKGYSPENCRWATHTEQTRNQRSNFLITINGETKCLAEWCEISGVNYSAARGRIKRGMPPEIAVTIKGRVTKQDKEANRV